MTPLEYKYKDFAHVMAILCNRTANYYSFIKQIFIIILVLPSSVMAVLNSGISETHMRIPNIIINACTALLISLNNSLKISEKADKNNQLSLKFAKLEHEIEQCISMNTITPDKINGFINSYDILLEQCDNFPQWIKDNVKKLNNNRYLPHMFNGGSPPDSPTVNANLTV